MNSKNINIEIHYRPRALFIILFLSISLVAYGGLGLEADLWIALLGMVIPLVWAVLSSRAKSNPKSPSQAPPWEKEFLPPLSPAVWLVFVLLLVFSRFYQLTQIPFWPVGDEGTFAFYAMKLTEKWDRRLLYGDTLLEPFLIWVLALFFKAFHVSLDSLRSFSALVSLLTIAAGYWAARQFFSRSLSFLAVALMAFNFWALVCSRQCHLGSFMLLWQFLTLALLGICLKTRRERPWLAVAALGVVLGLGFYIYTPWAMMAVAALICLLFRKKTAFLENAKMALLAGFILLLVAFPMARERFFAGGNSYVQDLLDWHKAHEYFMAIFFYGFRSAPYGPSWGGLLNSLMGSLFCVGLVECIRWRKHPLVQWLALAGVLFFLPGALTTHLQLHRIALLYPLLIVVSTLGAQVLLVSFQKAKKHLLIATAVLVLLAATADAYHFFGPGQDRKAYTANQGRWRYIEFHRAYQMMKAEAKQGKKFRVLSHFFNSYNDHTFEVAAAPLDGAGPSGSSSRPVEEVAVVTNVNYRPFLESRFPGSRWTWLCPELPAENGGMVLGWIPYDPSHQPALEAWLKADRSFAAIEDEYMYRTPHQPLNSIVEHLIEAEDICRDDPFLKSEWGNKIAFYTFRDPSLGLEPAVKALRKSLTGYPAANLNNELGLLLLSQGDARGARLAFEAAVKAPVNQTWAAENLKLLEKLAPPAK